MKYTLTFLITLFLSFFTSCADAPSDGEGDISTYYLKYETSTNVVGSVSFLFDNITNGHIGTLSDFSIDVKGCSVDKLNSKITPDSLTISDITPRGDVTFDIVFLSACSNTQLVLSANYTDTHYIDGKLLTSVDEKTYTLDIDGLQNDITGDTQIEFKTEDGSYKISLLQKKDFSVKIYDEDKNELPASAIEDITISLGNKSIATLIDSNDKVASSFSFSNQNDISLTLKSDTISGLVPINVTVTYKDADKIRTINNTFNIIVESGPPTSISISYTYTDQDKERGKFIENFAISVTDKYSNLVNTNPEVSVGAIVGYANYDSGTNHRIFVNSRFDTLGTLSSEGLNLNRDFITSTNTIDLSNDVLVTFGDDYKYSASGKWDMSSVSSDFISILPYQYDGAVTSGLGYAIGRNQRQDTCNLGDEWIGQAKLKDGTTTVDDSGTALVELSYDYYLTGKDILLYVNIIGKDNQLDRTMKIGEAKKHTLRGHGVEILTSLTLEATGANSATRRFYAWIKDTSEPYRNARFSFSRVESDSVGSIVNVTHMSIESCEDGGHAYVEYEIKSADNNTTYSITLADPYIINEF